MEKEAASKADILETSKTATIMKQISVLPKA